MWSSSPRKRRGPLKHNCIGTEHILLGLLREEGLAARILESVDITAELVRAQVVRFVDGI